MSDQAVDQILYQAQFLSNRQKLQIIQRLSSSILDNSITANVSAANSKRVNLPTDELTHQIIGSAMKVHSARGSGFREDTFQRDLEERFTLDQLQYERQKLLSVYDSMNSRVLIGYYIPDFIVDNRVVVEIKALNSVDDSHIAQVIGYLAVTGCQVGLLINFGERTLDVRRILPPKDVSTHKVNRQWLFVPEWMRGEVESII